MDGVSTDKRHVQLAFERMMYTSYSIEYKVEFLTYRMPHIQNHTVDMRAPALAEYRIRGVAGLIMRV